MADTETTGSLIRGEKVGLVAGLGLPEVMYLHGNPSGLIIAVQASGLAIDVAGGSIYMALTKNGKDWIALGSVAY